ncbi:MAG: hypothetical protein JNK23_03590 [Opitutaceae bacterium]|nr:hypothetical protein [Opitutaceae bacterium]
MKSPTLLELPLPANPAPLSDRAPWPEPTHLRPLWRPARAGHDLLVPNPRPDLTTDPHTLLMLETG